ncbi:MAG: hypothetical protein AB8H80_04505 [Planctomycetota bacterium]
MQIKRPFWPRIALLAATILALVGLILAGLDQVGIGPNLGLRFGYFGRFNRILARIEASAKVEVVATSLHRDLQLEDFYVTVLTTDGRKVKLAFEEAHTRPFKELCQELQKVGL